MTSQSSKAGETPSDAYREAWAGMQYLAENGKMSWSGRESNRVFRNLGEGRFTDVSALTGADWLEDGRAAARLDWDEDGRQDLVLRNRNAPRLRLMLNRWPGTAHWLQLDLVGTRCNSDAIGAQVVVEAGGRRLRNAVRAGEGFLAASSKRLHFGLGEAEHVDRIVVRWPGGGEDVIENLAADRRWRIVQGEGRATEAAKEPALHLLSTAPAPARADEKREVTRVPLLSRLPMAELPLPGWQDPARTVGALAGAPVLINLWSTTCAGCIEELELLGRRKAVLARSGLQIVPLLVEDGADPERARAMLAEHGLEALAGTADERTQTAIRAVFEDVFHGEAEVPLPCSLLLDARGQVCVIYPGVVRFRELSEDVEAVRRLPTDAPLDPRLCGGRVLVPRVRDFAALAARFAELGFAAAAAACERRASEVQAALGGR